MKLSKKRRAIARDLLARLDRGPSFYEPIFADETPFDAVEAARQYQIWSQSWIISQFKELIPELKESSE